jgi:hypothetical protein
MVGTALAGGVGDALYIIVGWAVIVALPALVVSIPRLGWR